jgi:hypothetical protein
VNGVVTRHNITLPGQQERQYPTQALREVLAAFAPQEDVLPDDLVAAWVLEEQDALLVARHTATGVATAPGSLAEVVRTASCTSCNSGSLPIATSRQGNERLPGPPCSPGPWLATNAP